MDKRSRPVNSPGTEAPSPEVEAGILATVYAFVLESYESQSPACVPEGPEDDETWSTTQTRKVEVS